MEKPIGKSLRSGLWFLSVGGWLAVILWALITQDAGVIVAFVLLAIVTWVMQGMVISWQVGIVRHIRRHLKMRIDHAETLNHQIPRRQTMDVRRALESLFVAQAPGSRRFGISQAYLSDFAQRLSYNHQIEGLEWESYRSDVSDWQELPTNAVYLLKHDGDVPYVVSVTTTDDEYASKPRNKTVLQILAPSRADCAAIRDAILDIAQQETIYRQRTIIVQSGSRRAEPVKVQFTSVDPVEREQIILPQSVFDVVERTAVRQLDAGDILTRAGHRTRTAILMFGPPGTGKTLLTRYLVTQSKGRTTILLQGFRRGLVREAFRLARYCEPSLIVLEDVDLIAVRRQSNRRGTTALHELLDELDGLAPEARVSVLMTTNRPEALEPALASRPGRVTQAIEFPLPDADIRLQLLKLFTHEVGTDDVNFDQWVSRTRGSSPAFLEELTRRAILFASERSGMTDTDSTLRNVSPKLTDADLENALDEILTSGGALTQNLLGFKLATDDSSSSQSER